MDLVELDGVGSDLSSFRNLDEGQELRHLQKELTDVSSYLRRPVLFRNNNLASGDRAFATCEYTRGCTRLLTKNRHGRPQESHASRFLACLNVLKFK